MRTIAIIPARGGSKGIPGKNKKHLGGLPLIARTITAAKESSSIDKVFVTSNDKSILEIASKWGAETILRPEELSTDQSSSESALIHSLQHISKTGAMPERFVFLQCTSPFTTSGDIDHVISEMDEKQADCAFSVSEDHGFIWQLDENGFGVGVNHNPLEKRVRRQDLKKSFRENGAIYAIKANLFIHEKNRFCGKILPVPFESSFLEIDTPEDWQLAEAFCLSRSLSKSECLPPNPIRALIMDFDGVHTNDQVLVDENGVESVICSRKDGMGIELLRKSGLQLLILSKETNKVVQKRAQKLRVDVLHGVENKSKILESWLFEKKLNWNDIAYIGNDINDVECLRLSGFALVPNDAHQQALLVADYVLDNAGGDGALREAADLILSMDDKDTEKSPTAVPSSNHKKN